MNDPTPNARQLLDEMATPEHQAATYLANALHVQRCGAQPDHGPYAHEDEAKWFASVLAEVGLLAAPTVDRDALRTLVTHWRGHSERLEQNAGAEGLDPVIAHGEQCGAAVYARAADDLAPLVGMRARRLSAAQRAAGMTQ